MEQGPLLGSALGFLTRAGSQTEPTYSGKKRQRHFLACLSLSVSRVTIAMAMPPPGTCEEPAMPQQSHLSRCFSRKIQEISSWTPGCATALLFLQPEQ